MPELKERAASKDRREDQSTDERGASVDDSPSDSSPKALTLVVVSRRSVSQVFLSFPLSLSLFLAHSIPHQKSKDLTR